MGRKPFTVVENYQTNKESVENHHTRHQGRKPTKKVKNYIIKQKMVEIYDI